MGKSVDDIRAELEAAEAAEAAAAEEALTLASAGDGNPHPPVTIVGFQAFYSDGTTIQFAPGADEGTPVDTPVDPAPVDVPATSTDNPEGTKEVVTTTENIHPGADAAAVNAAQ